MTHGVCFAQVIWYTIWSQHVWMQPVLFLHQGCNVCIQYVCKTCILFSFQTVSLCQHVPVNDFCGSFLFAVQMHITSNKNTYRATVISQ